MSAKGIDADAVSNREGHAWIGDIRSAHDIGGGVLQNQINIRGRQSSLAGFNQKRRYRRDVRSGRGGAKEIRKRIAVLRNIATEEGGIGAIDARDLWTIGIERSR